MRIGHGYDVHRLVRRQEVDFRRCGNFLAKRAYNGPDADVLGSRGNGFSALRGGAGGYWLFPTLILGIWGLTA